MRLNLAESLALRRVWHAGRVERQGRFLVNIVAFIISFVLFVGGMVMMGYSFEPFPYQLELFSAGIAAVTLAVIVPVHILKRIDGA